MLITVSAMSGLFCHFCRLPKERILIETGNALAFFDAYPLSPGHALVAPKRHVSHLFDLPDDELQSIWTLVGRIRGMVKAKHSPDGFNVGVNEGEAAGQTVGHAHVHIIPRYKGDVP